jgi:hypothetical protein
MTYFVDVWRPMRTARLSLFPGDNHGFESRTGRQLESITYIQKALLKQLQLPQSCHNSHWVVAHIVGIGLS